MESENLGLHRNGTIFPPGLYARWKNPDSLTRFPDYELGCSVFWEEGSL